MPDATDRYFELLEEMADDYLLCRGLAHDWLVTSDLRVVDANRELRRSRGGYVTFVERVVTCERCGKRRSDAFAVTKVRGHTALQKLNSSYSLVKGFDMKGVGFGAGRRDLVMGELWDRAATKPKGRRRL